MQDILTLAATATLYSLIAFIALGYPLYVWHRTRPVAPVAAIPTPIATIEPETSASLPALFAQVDAIMAHPVYADAPATPVKRYRKVSPTPVQEVIAPCPKRKRGRPRKDAAA